MATIVHCDTFVIKVILAIVAYHDILMDVILLDLLLHCNTLLDVVFVATIALQQASLKMSFAIIKVFDLFMENMKFYLRHVFILHCFID